MHPKPAGCVGCPAYDCGQSYVPGTGPKEAKLVMLGQGPGETEAHSGRPFIGPSGERLSQWLAKAGIQRSEVYIDNVVRCWLPKNRPPTPAEAQFCWDAHVKEAVVSRSPLVVTPIGIPAMRQVLGKSASELDAGSVTMATIPGTVHQAYSVPILHPAYIQRGQWAQEPAQIIHLSTARGILEKGTFPVVDIHTPPKGTILRPTQAQVREFVTDPDCKFGVAVDIETAGDYLVCLGLCRIRDLQTIVIPFRTFGAAQYWSYPDLVKVTSDLYDFFADPSIGKVFQNGQGFDIPYLHKMGFVVEGYSFDTMLAQHVLYPEMPKDLEFLATLYLNYPRWKHLRDLPDGK